MIRPFHFAPNFEFDEWKTITLTRKQTNAFKQKKADDPARYAYRFLFWGAEVRGSGFLAGAFLAEAVFGVLCLPAAPFLGALPGLEGAPFLGLPGFAEV